ncbi:hypothetical protein [Gilvimarinus sp. 1_MG-2023]|uniref:hypothetical protein n=1 Tax=Gilvimarinus sp. 1_MG-2023 TaxID=3062638 RepID=UPI0026E30C19|nr:hypothetical protein [Gilvimarinus sp. 1_MG-2023]MDO6748474.1 hypothetical protein [Gilvimarinus sp. 1_MG-2023]
MMLKKFVIYLALMVVALQSGMTLGDIHHWHQSGNGHWVFDASHQPADTPPSTFTDSNNSDTVVIDSNSHELDCQNCCQCHGHFCSALLLSAQHLLPSKAISPPTEYTVGTRPEPLESFLRPPKA